MLALGLLSSCCIRYDFKGSQPLPDQIKTFSVDYFNNKASQVNPSLSQVFTEKLKDKLLRETRLTMVQSDGDLAFSGYISGYTVTPAAINSNNTATQNRLTISINIKYVNKYQPKTSFEQTFSNFEDFDANRTLADVENTLTEDISDKIVQDLFNKTIINW
jgi:hypothetical protein